MIPFCRTVDEGRRVIAAMAANGLRQGEDGLEIYPEFAAWLVSEQIDSISLNPDVAISTVLRVAAAEAAAEGALRNT